MFEKIITYSKILGVHAEARLRTLLQLFRVLTVLSVGTHEVPSQKRSKEYLFLATSPAVTNAVGVALFQLGKACAHDVVFLCETVLPDVQMALWIANKKNEKLAELVNPQKRGFKRSRANPETKNAAIAAAAHRIATTAVEAVIQVARKREAATRKMSANVAAAAVATVVAEARKRDQAAAMAEAEKRAFVLKLNREAAKRRAAVERRTAETRKLAHHERQRERAEVVAAAEAERQRREEVLHIQKKERRKAQRDAKKAVLATKLQPQTTKPVSKTTTPVSHTTFRPVTPVLAQAHAAVSPLPRVVVGSATRTATKSIKDKKPPVRLTSWTLPDKRCASAVVLQAAWRRHVAIQLRLLAQYHKAAAMKNAPETEQATHRNDVDANTNKTTMRSTKPMCTYTPCLRPGCRFSHSDNQFQPDAAKFAKTRAGRANHTIDNAKTGETKVDKDATLDSNATKSGTDRTESTNECPVCFTGLALDNIGVLACGHCACFKCAQACVARDARCPICRAEATSVLKMRV